MPAVLQRALLKVFKCDVGVHFVSNYVWFLPDFDVLKITLLKTMLGLWWCAFALAGFKRQGLNSFVSQKCVINVSSNAFELIAHTLSGCNKSLVQLPGDIENSLWQSEVQSALPEKAIKILAGNWVWTKILSLFVTFQQICITFVGRHAVHLKERVF